MQAFHTVHSSHHGLAFFTATATATCKEQFLCRKLSRAFLRSCPSRRLVTGFESVTAPTGIDCVVHAEEGGSLFGEDVENFEDSSESSDDEGEFLDPELWKNVVMLSCDSTVDGGVCYVYLVGTSHLSKESCQEVEAVIDFLKPEVVFLELCPARTSLFKVRTLKVPTIGEMVQMWKKNRNLFAIIYNFFALELATKLEVQPGDEFHVAYEEAKKYGGRVVLGDRPVQITLQRTWMKMPLRHKIKLLSTFMLSFFSPSSEVINKKLKEMDDGHMPTIQEVSKEFPTIMETIIHERDKYMSINLLRIAREQNSVVAVVGKGHLHGIQENWEQDIEVRQLLTIPTRSSKIPVGKILIAVGVTVGVFAIITGLIKKLNSIKL
ncbi:uncharacterized protein LOC127240114 isoform X2 [Andrographis paniculata]|uniref:uncharacterized protein LOC127240114 isoform X2 n=1 Tax=Andrographis paniculata TaxID=175694 RepID=UPI0021E70199|nr:uncharacterized protein LOC127240114 isoform X2 [Andrographis paniculata]